ncbi:pitrilysin family protein [Sorangium sp. So ce260]|uniref:M16 family metallopeptidase n=1 Tax=Sorangium sp. So ce260 TaxID=3133291 RepID=UPI003F637DE5
MRRARTWWTALIGATLAACGSRQELPPPVSPLTPTPDAEFRATAPPLAAEPMLRVQDIRSMELENGMTTLVVERPELPLVTMVYVNRAARDDGASRNAGLAELTARMLNEGTRLENGEVLRQLRISGERPRWSASPVGTAIAITTLASGADKAAWLLARLVQHPVFDADALENARSAQSEALFSYSLRISSHLNELAFEALYGPEHPRARLINDSSSNLKGFSGPRVRSFYSRQYGPRDSALITVGSVRAEAVFALAGRHFGAWSPAEGQAPPEPAPPALVPRGDRTIRIDAVAGAASDASLVVALPCAGWSDPDALAFDLIAMLIGGLSVSRSAAALRHDTGISYGVRAVCRQRRTSGEFLIELSVDVDRAGESLEKILTEIRRFKSSPVTRAELETAKMRYLGQTAAAVSSTPGLAGSLADVYLNAQPLDYLATLERRVHAIGAEQLQRAAARYFDAQMGVAVYGPPQLLHDQLVGLGDVRWSALKRTSPK